jgi:undecaprenyl-diphosphatase
MSVPTVQRPDSPSPTDDTRARCLRATVALGVLFLVLLVMVTARWHPLLSLDTSVVDGLHHQAVRDRGLTHVNRVLTDWIWSPTTMRVLLAGVVVAQLVRHAMRVAVWLTVCGVAGALLQTGVKAAVGRARPHWPDPVDSATNAAFPSGHAMTAAVVCTALLWLFLHSSVAARHRWLRVVAWTLAVVSVVGVGFTRVFLGVHWPSDVVGGWLLGGFVVAGAAAVSAPYRAGWRA